jgi:hypothetical protein
MLHCHRRVSVRVRFLNDKRLLALKGWLRLRFNFGDGSSFACENGMEVEESSENDGRKTAIQFGPVSCTLSARMTCQLRRRCKRLVAHTGFGVDEGLKVIWVFSQVLDDFRRDFSSMA